MMAAFLPCQMQIKRENFISTAAIQSAAARLL